VIVETLINHLGISKKDSVNIVESFFEIIKDELHHGNDVKIAGFEKWTVNEKHARRGRNPKTGKDLIIDARWVVTFKSSPLLRDTVNTGK